MRHKSTPEEMAEPQPIMYRRNKLGRFFNYFGEDVTGRMLSSFPWKDDEQGEFEWKKGWTRFRHFYVDASLLPDDFPELIASRFTHVVV